MQRLECPACHSYVDEKDSECPECYAELPSRTGLPPATGTFVPRRHISAADALPVAVARVERGALPAGPSSRPSGVLQLARLLTVVMAGWLVMQTVNNWNVYREGYTGALLPAWSAVFAVGVGCILYGVLIRRRWALGWALGLAIFNGISIAHSAVLSGITWFWSGVVIHAAYALVLRVARDEFVEGPNDGRNTQLGRVLTILAIAGSLYVAYVTSAERGTERGRTAFAREMQQKYIDSGLHDVHVAASGRTLVITTPESDAELDDSAAAMRAEMNKYPRHGRAWKLGFERIRLTNGTHEAIILDP